VVRPNTRTSQARFTINNQPAGGRASFDQLRQPLTSVDADIPYRSTVAHGVPRRRIRALINVTVAELEFVNGQCSSRRRADGPHRANPDIDNPDIDNPDIDNPDIDNPDIDNVEVYNPTSTIPISIIRTSIIRY
jgi:hypothetical protein